MVRGVLILVIMIWGVNLLQTTHNKTQESQNTLSMFQLLMKHDIKMHMDSFCIKYQKSTCTVDILSIRCSIHICQSISFLAEYFFFYIFSYSDESRSLTREFETSNKIEECAHRTQMLPVKKNSGINSSLKNTVMTNIEPDRPFNVPNLVKFKMICLRGTNITLMSRNFTLLSGN